MRSMNRVVQQSRRARGAAKKKNNYAQEYDTNVFQVAFDVLANKGNMATGDAEFCKHCGAVFNQTSKLYEQGEDQIWECEFCHTKNEVMIDEAEIPTALEMTYLLEAPAQV